METNRSAHHPISHSAPGSIAKAISFFPSPFGQYTLFAQYRRFSRGEMGCNVVFSSPFLFAKYLFRCPFSFGSDAPVRLALLPYEARKGK